MPWYTGPTLQAYLEEIDVDTAELEKGFSMPVQRVSRPDHTFRGFQGQVEANRVELGDEVTVLPSGEKANVKSILVAGKEAAEARFGQPATIQLDREIDVSRGCVLERGSGLKTASSVTATILWMDDEPLAPGRDYYVKLGTREIPGMLTQILYSIDVNTGARQKAEALEKNEIAVVRLAFTERIVVDEFKNHRTMGELILIDRVSHATSACGVVERVEDAGENAGDSSLRMVVKAQQGIIVEFPLGDAANGFTLDQVKAVERLLVTRGRDAYLYVPDAQSHVTEVVAHLNRAGVTVLLALSPEAARNTPRRNDNLVFRSWQQEAGRDPEAIAAYIERMTSGSARVEPGGGYI